MINLIKTWFAFSIAPLCFGGGGGSTTSISESTTNTTTHNIDNRMVVSDAGIGLSNINGSTVTLTDHGAMKTASDMFQMATAANTKDFGQVLNTSSDALKGILSFADKAVTNSFNSAQVAQSNALSMLDTAQSKGTLDNKTIVMLGLGAAAVLSVFAFKR